MDVEPEGDDGKAAFDGDETCAAHEGLDGASDGELAFGVDEDGPAVVDDLAHVFEAGADGAFLSEREAVAQQGVQEPEDRVLPELRGSGYGHAASESVGDGPYD